MIDLKRTDFSFRNRTVSVYAVLAVTLFFTLKWIDTGFVMAAIDTVFSLFPFALILAVVVTAYLRYRSYLKIAADLPNPVDGVRERIRVETLQTIVALLAITFFFYLLYSPESYLPVFIVLSDAFLRVISVETVFLVLSFGMILLLSGAFLYAVFRYFRTRHTDAYPSFLAFRTRLFQAAFFSVLSLFLLSLPVYVDAYRPLMDYLASAMAPLLGGEATSSDPSFQSALVRSVGNVRAAVSESNDSLRNDLGQTRSDLDRAIAQSGLDVAGSLSDEIKTRLSNDGGTIGGSLVIKNGLTVRDISAFEDILPISDGRYALGDPDFRFKSFYAEDADFSGTVTGLLVPTGTFDMRGFLVMNIGSGSSFTEDGGLDLVGPLTTTSPIAPRYGGTGLDTSSETGVPILSSGIWTVASVLPASLGGTGLSNPLTQGSVAFAGASGILAQDNANLFWDDTNNRLSLGAGSSPLAKMHINGGTGSLSTGIALGDGDTGLYEASDDVLRIATAGSDRVTVLANGYVGIGTTSPGAKLVVYSTTSSDQLRLTTDGGIRTYKIGRSGIDGSLDFEGFQNGNTGYNFKGYGGTSYLYIQNGGNVGIGTTTPPAALSVGSGSILSIGSGGTAKAVVFDNVNAVSGMQMGNLSTGTSADFRFLIKDTTDHYFAFMQPGVNYSGSALWGLARNSTDFILNLGGTTRNMAIGTNDSGKHLYLAAGGTIRQTIDGTTGNVGIGTTSPGAYLNVVGTALFGTGTTLPYPAAGYSLNVVASDVAAVFQTGLATSSVSGRAFSIGVSGELFTRINFYSNGFYGVGSGSATRDVFFGRSAANTFRIGGDYDGSGTGHLLVNNTVGIGGVSSASASLQVKGAGATSSTTNMLLTDSAGTALLTVRDDGYVGIGTASPSELLTVYNGSTTGTYTTSGWAHSSDARLKTNVTALGGALDTVSRLQGVSFNWKTNPTGDRQIGFIAQDVLGILPEVVTGNEDDGYGIAYGNLTALLVEAVKELHTEQGTVAASLESRFDTLDLGVDMNATTLAELQSSVDAQLDIVGDALSALGEETDTLDNRLTTLDSRVLSTESDIMDIVSATNSLDDRLADLEDGIALIRDEHEALMNFFQTFEMSNLVSTDEEGNVDLFGGTLSAEIVETGGLVIEIIDPDAPTVGTAVIYPIAMDVDGDDADDYSGLSMDDDAVKERDGKSVTVKTSAVGEDARILVTPDVPIPIAATDRRNGKDFRVFLDRETEEPIRFDWMIVTEEEN